MKVFYRKQNDMNETGICNSFPIILSSYVFIQCLSSGVRTIFSAFRCGREYYGHPDLFEANYDMVVFE